MSQARNELCACGSGKKYKKCCALIAQSSPSQAQGRPLKVPAALAQEVAGLGRLLSMGAHSQFDAGISSLLARHPDCAPAWNMLGVSRQIRGQDGIPALRQAAELLPGNADAQKNLGLALVEARCFEEAVERLQECIALGGATAPTHNSLGCALQGCARYDEAVAQYQRSIELAPQSVIAWLNVGRCRREKGDVEGAVEWLEQSISRFGSDSELLNELGECLREQKKLDEAADAFRTAYSLRPTQLSSLNNLAVTLSELGQWKEAKPIFDKLVAHPACEFPVFENVAKMYRANGEYIKALHCLQEAAQRFANNVNAQAQLAEVMLALGQSSAAVEAMRRAVELDPQSSRMFSNYLFMLLHDPAATVAGINSAHREFARRFASVPVDCVNELVSSSDRSKPLRVGFVSADFRHHAMMSFFEPLLKALSGFNDLQLLAFYTHEKHDEVTERARQSFDAWHDVATESTSALLKTIREAKIDILVDMSGHTGGNRLPVFARKAAPIQVTCWGYPGTTGIAQMDYLLGGAHWPPKGLCEDQFSERICYLPSNSVFMPENPSPEVSDLPAKTNGFLTFASFNHPRKLSENVFALWGALMRELPESRILIGGFDKGDSGEWIIKELEEKGVANDRIRIVPRCGVYDYLKLHQEVDICLNAYPYTGGTTLCHALWMGVPTLTLAGEAAATLTGPGVLAYVDLQNWVAYSNEDLIQKAKQFAGDIEGLSELRRGLRQRFASSDFGPDKADQVASDIRRAFRLMWERHCAGDPPVTLDLSNQSNIPVPI